MAFELEDAGYNFRTKKVYFAFIWCVDNGHYMIAKNIFMHDEIPKRDKILYTQDLCVEIDIPGVKFLYKLMMDFGLLDGYDEEHSQFFERC